MCYFSVENARTRQARIADRLVLKQFPSGGVGFIEPNEPAVAVCLRQGTRLKVTIPQEMQERLFLPRESEATFAEIRRGERSMPFDALELRCQTFSSYRFLLAELLDAGPDLQAEVLFVPEEVPTEVPEPENELVSAD